MKFKVKAKDCQLLVKARASIGEVINEKELNRFSRVYLRGFLKPKVIKKNLIEYAGPIGISLYERLKKPTTKREFLFILEQIVVAVQKLQANNMGLNNLVTELQYVYINEVTKEVQFIYLPTEKDLQKPNLVEFIESVAYSVKPADEKDRETVSRFIYFFKAMPLFDIRKIEAFVAKEDRSVVNTIKRQNAGQSGFMTDKPKHYYEHYDKKREQDNDFGPTGRLADEDDATGLLTEDNDDYGPTERFDGDNDPTELLAEGADDATGLLNDEEDTAQLNWDTEATGYLSVDDGYEGADILNADDGEEATGLLNDDNANVYFPTLFRILTGEKISIDKPVFRLGKEASYVDYSVASNTAVSRGHADIITRGDRFFVKDLNAKNHTYINGQELPIYIETEIHDGDRLSLANEEFIFNI